MKFKKNPFHDRIQITTIKRKNGKNYTIRETRDRYFFPDEWMAFFDQLKDSQKFTFTFLINTGARINELRSIRVSDVDLERQNLVLRWTKSRNNDGSRRMRTIPISTQHTKYLKKRIVGLDLKPTDVLGVLSTPAANIGLKKALRKAQIPDWSMFSVHNIRKTTEMYLLALGVTGLTIEKHMGHSLQIASRFYVSPDIFTYQDKQQMRDIIGDLYLR